MRINALKHHDRKPTVWGRSCALPRRSKLIRHTTISGHVPGTCTAAEVGLRARPSPCASVVASDGQRTHRWCIWRGSDRSTSIEERVSADAYRGRKRGSGSRQCVNLAKIILYVTSVQFSTTRSAQFSTRSIRTKRRTECYEPMITNSTC